MPRPLVLTARVLLVGTLVLVTYFSLTPSPPTAPAGWDKAWHLAAYLTLAFLLVLSVPTRRFRLKLALLLALATIAYGVLIELIQEATGRQLELADMGMDAIGAVIGAVTGIVFRRGIERRRSPDPD